MLSDEAEMTREGRTWWYPYNIDAQSFEIVNFGNDAFEIAPAGVRSVFERGRVDLGMILGNSTVDSYGECWFSIFTW